MKVVFFNKIVLSLNTGKKGDRLFYIQDEKYGIKYTNLFTITKVKIGRLVGINLTILPVSMMVAILKEEQEDSDATKTL